jgi:hypothetical protein
VEDHDLFLHKLPLSKEFNSYASLRAACVLRFPSPFVGASMLAPSKWIRPSILACGQSWTRSVSLLILSSRRTRLTFPTFLIDPAALIQVGQGIIAGESATIDAEIAGAFPIRLGGPEKNGAFGTCLAVVTEHSDLRSEMGNRLVCPSQALAVPFLCFLSNLACVLSLGSLSFVV